MLGARGHVLARLLFELVEVVAREMGHDGLLAVDGHLGQLVHDDAERVVGGDRDEREALRLAVDLVLVELDLEYVAHAELADGVAHVPVRRPPGQIAHVARDALDVWCRRRLTAARRSARRHAAALAANRQRRGNCRNVRVAVAAAARHRASRRRRIGAGQR